MKISCFFCLNLLSEFLDGWLPTSRHEQIREHLDICERCRNEQQDLRLSLSLLKDLPRRSLDPTLTLRAIEASRTALHRTGVLKQARTWLILVFGLLLLFGSFAITLNYFFPEWRAHEDIQWTRYYPLSQGAAEIVEDQANWFQVREPTMRSFWEEGGMSPEDFEKTFQGQGGSKEKEP